MDYLKKIAKDRNTVTFITVVSLFVIGVEYILQGLFFESIIFLFDLDSRFLYRLLSLTVGVILLTVAYISYLQNKVIVDERLNKTKDKVSSGISNFREEISKPNQPNTETGVNTTETTVVEVDESSDSDKISDK